MALAFLLGALPATAPASPLFDDDATLDISLRGPLGTISEDRKNYDAAEHPFVLTIGDQEVPVSVRVRGHSRRILCPFPPLRLRFRGDSGNGTVFEGQDRLKLVTHCRNGRERSENDLLDEYTAYRIFNQISDAGHRVRLLRIRYEDTDGASRNLDRPYYAFVIEPEAEFAARLGGSFVALEGILYSRLNESQTASLNVFQYLIGNGDWSFVTAVNVDACCHNVSLLEKDDELYPIPRDFDLSGLVNARYAKPPEGARNRKVTTRVYRGYCRSDIESVGVALDEIVELREDIMTVVAATPAVGRETSEDRSDYIDEFFDAATNDRDKLLEEFDSDCIGAR